MSSATELIENSSESGRGRDATEAVQGLTPRQREVLALIGQGLSTAEIARRLYRTVKTIESHRLMLGKRLGARNRVELARIAIRAGLTDLSPDAVVGFVEDEEGPEGAGHDPGCRVLAMIDATTSSQQGRAYLESLVSQIAAAFDAQASYVMRLGADGTAKSVAGWTERGAAQELRYSFNTSEDRDMAAGEVRQIEGPAKLMLANVTDVSPNEVKGTLLAPLYSSRGHRLGTLALFLKTAPEESSCSKEIVRLLGNLAAAELERKESEDRFNHLQALVSSAAERIGIWERNLRDNQLTWSTETYKILGFEPHSIVPSRDKFFAVVHPQDLQRVKDVSDEVISRCSTSAIEYRVIRPDGAERRILACYEASPDLSGRPGWVFGTIKDVTAE